MPPRDREPGVGFTRAQRKTTDKAKCASLRGMFIHAFNKYLLSTYYVPGTVLCALERNRQVKKGGASSPRAYILVTLSHAILKWFVCRSPPLICQFFSYKAHAFVTSDSSVLATEPVGPKERHPKYFLN